MNDKNFVNYVLDFYGQRGIYEEFFKPDGVTRGEVETALKIRKTQADPPFDGDSFDRELVRDIMFVLRGEVDNLEYPKVVEWVKQNKN